MKEESEVVDIPLVGVVALLALLSTMWQYDFFSNYC